MPTTNNQQRPVVAAAANTTSATTIAAAVTSPTLQPKRTGPRRLRPNGLRRRPVDATTATPPVVLTSEPHGAVIAVPTQVQVVTETDKE